MMAPERYFLIDEEFQRNVLNGLSELKALIKNSSIVNAKNQDNDLMDTADLTAYLKIDRRTVYKHRLSGMPFVRKENGKLYYWKSEIDKYFGKADPK